VPDDRFADLGSGRRAGERFADLDRSEPEERPEPPRRRGRYTWVVGVASLILIIVVAVNSLPNAGAADHGPVRGRSLPHFAAPSARSSLDGDPNIKQSPGDTGASNHTPACAVRLAGAIRSCDYTSKPLVLTLIVPTTACEDYLDRVDRMRARFPGVNFLAVISSPTGRARGALRGRTWQEPIAIDRNGAILTVLRAPPYCATTIFAYRGGIVRSTKTTAQAWTDAQLAAVIRATEAR
jgi:hypothetical protein